MQVLENLTTCVCRMSHTDCLFLPRKSLH
jgi:hypothetical protein